GSVSALAASGSDLYAGGHFSTAGGVSASRIAKWDGSAWSALGSGANGIVWALAVSGRGSDLYAGGDFTTAGGVSASRIARAQLSSPEQEINVQGNGVSIASGDTTPDLADHTDFGSVNVSSGTIVRTFTIQNTGGAALSVST